MRAMTIICHGSSFYVITLIILQTKFKRNKKYKNVDMILFLIMLLIKIYQSVVKATYTVIYVI